MDQVAQIMGRMNLDPVKEPRGFIKLIQVIIAIFAFATTTSVSTSSSFTVNCDPDPKTVEIKFGYPFKVNSATFMTPVCANSTEIQVESHPYGDFRSSAEFYVFIGVMAFLYSVGAIILYIFFDDKYRVIPMIPTVDFVISVVFTLLWLISSSAWAQGVTDVKYYTSPDEIILLHMGDECVEDGMCTDPQSGNFASLNVSLIFGFLNTFVWGCNLWFLFKETKWHKEPEREIAQQQQQTPSVPSPVDIPSPQQRI